MISNKDLLIKELINDNRYKIYKNGKIKTIVTTTGKNSVSNKWRCLIPSEINGYYFFKYKNKRIALHRIIYQKFIGELDSSLVIHHRDHNKKNNRIKNLKQTTHHENMQESRKKHGPVTGHFKINFEIANQIRSDYKTNKFSYKDLAKKYSLSKSTISYIIKNIIWKTNPKPVKNIPKHSNCRRSDAHPKWVSQIDLNHIYINKPKSYVVDHIIPLWSNHVCGLHVPWNLQYLTKEENLKKGNSFDFTNKNQSWKKKK